MAFTKACSTADVQPGQMKAFKVNDKDVAVANVDGKFFAISGMCTHAGAPLADGELKGTTITCPLHAADFDVTTGKALSLPAVEGCAKIELKVEGDDILVDV